MRGAVQRGRARHCITLLLATVDEEKKNEQIFGQSSRVDQRDALELKFMMNKGTYFGSSLIEHPDLSVSIDVMFLRLM